MRRASICVAVFLIMLAPVPALAQSFGEGALVDGGVVQPVAVPTAATNQSNTGTILLDAIIDSLLKAAPQTAAVANSGLSTHGCVQNHNHDHDEHLLTRVNQASGISTEYVPGNLVNIRPFVATRYGRTVCLTRDAAEAWIKLDQAATAAGLEIMVTSGFRSADDQAALYQEYAPLYNTSHYKRVAKPGHSEHQLGTTLDVASMSNGYLAGYSFTNSPEWVWMQQHAHKYGFMVSYSQGSEELTGYQFEPWHWRYVGSDVATLLNMFSHSLAFEADYRTPASIVRSLSNQLSAVAASTAEVGG